MLDTLQVRVGRIDAEAEGIRSLRLETVDGRPLPAAVPGAHIDVHLGPGLTRQYSLTNGPDERADYRIAVKLEPASRGGSQALSTWSPGARCSSRASVMSRPIY